MIKPISEELEQRIKPLEEELSRYASLFSSASDHVAMFDRNYIYHFVNEAYLISYNKKREEIIGQSVPKLFGEEFFLKDLKKARQGSL